MENTPKSHPNIVFKKKLAPLPLFNQNQSPKHSFPSTSRDHLLTEPKSLRGAPEVALGLRSTKTRDLRNGNNYGRMCDQPFLEFSSFHYQQVFGSGGKKKVVLEPLDRKKKRVASSVQLVKSVIGKEPLIKVEDQAPEVPQIRIVKEKKVKDNRAVISHRYRINDNEATISFVSLKLVLTPEGNKEKKQISIQVGKDDLEKIYKYPQKAIEESVLQALSFTDQEGIQLKVTKNKNLNPDGQALDKTYPEKSGTLDVTLNNKIYSAAIYYPHLELCIPELNYLEKVMLRPLDLENLFEQGFKNLPDYASKFTLPSASSNNNDEDNYEELENLPTIIKKVVKEKTFGGLVLFKSAEIHLKNISEVNEAESQKAAEEQNPGRRVSIRKRNAAAAKSTILRIKVRDLVQFVKLTDEEIVNLIKRSIVFVEGQNLAINIEKESTRPGQQRHRDFVDVLPETSEKFTVQFDQSRFEGFIKFPTLELYVPESNFRDVVQLTRSQIQELVNSAFKNLEDYTHIFKQPPIEEVPQTSARQPETSQNEDIYTELENLPTIIKKVVKEKTFGGLVLFKSAEIHLKNISEVNEAEPRKAAEEQNPGRRVSIRKRNAAVAKSTLLRIKVRDLVQFVKLTDEEIVSLIKKSIVLGEGQKLEINIQKENETSDHQNRDVNILPDTSEKFTVQFDQSRFEGFIKFPTLELYVPESNFRDVVQLTRTQLQELLNSAFKNLEDYTRIFKQPPIEEAPQTSARQPKTPQNEDIYAELENLPTIIKKVVKEKDFGGLVLFKSAEIHLKNISEVNETEPQKAAEEQNPGRRVSVRKRNATAAKSTLLRIKVRDLVQFVKLSDGEIVNLIKKSIAFGEEQKLEINIEKESTSPDQQRHQDFVDVLPDISEKFTVQFDQSRFEGFIKFPTLELYVPESNFRDVVQLTRAQLQELLNSAFKNLEDYTHIFKQPPIQEAPQTSARQPEIPQNEDIYAELENLPTIIKKVVKEKTFGGLVLFKSAEIHLKNISEANEIEPQKAVEEQNPGRRVSIRKRNAAVAKSTLLRIKVRDLVQFVKLTDGEIVNLIKKSIVLGEGQKLEINIQKETPDQQRHQDANILPEISEKFNVQIDQSRFEGFIKFPTLELYVPESNFRDVVQLTRAQLQELLNSAFKNLEDYTHIFKQPPIQEAPQTSARQPEIPQNEDIYAELENLPTIIKKVVKEKTFGGLVLFKSAEIHLKNISEANEIEPQKAVEEQNPGRRVSIRKRNAAVAKSTLLRIKVRDLVQFVKLTDGEIVNLIKRSIVFGEGQKLEINIQKETPDQQRHQDANILPEISEKFNVQIDQSRFEGFIKFPTLELYVPESNFRDVVQLTRSQLQELLNSAFKNLEDYTRIFKQPPIQESPQTSAEQPKTPQNEDIYAELENLPTIIKKVVKEKNFGGLVLFKSAEIHLKNITEVNEAEPQKVAEEQNPGRRVSIRKRNATAAKSTLLRIKVRDLVQFVKLTDEEIVSLIKKSIVLREGQKLEINVQNENTSPDQQRHEDFVDVLPDTSEKFTVQFDQLHFEGFIKFPTLELYVPESNFRDVVHLTRSQLQELLNTAFKNLENYTNIFKQPPVESQEPPKVQSIKIDDNMNDYPNDDKPLSYNQQTLSAKKI